MLRYLLLASLFVVLLGFEAQSNEHSKTKQQHDVKSLSLNNGLVQSSVRDIIQDKSGLIWLGTEAGIQIFDGLHLKRLNQMVKGELSAIIPSLWVNRFLQTEQGQMFIATKDNGLLIYDPRDYSLKQFSAKGFDSLFSNTNHFDQLCQTPNGDIWASGELGLTQINSESGDWKVIINNPNRSYFGALVCLPDSIIIQREHELVKWYINGGQSQTLAINDPAANLTDVVMTSLNTQFNLVGKHDGLYRLSNDFTRLIKIWPSEAHPIEEVSEQQPTLAAKLIQNQVNDILYASEQDVWLATENYGLILVNLANGEVTEHLHHLKDSIYSLSGNNVTRLMRDHSNLIWASIKSIGVDRVFTNHESMQTYYTYSDDIKTNNDITAISDSSDGDIWLVGGNSDVRKLSNDGSSNISYTKQIEKIYLDKGNKDLLHIADIKLDSLNQLWLTTKQGILKVNPQTGDDHFYPIKEANITGPRSMGLDVFEDEKGGLYITDLGALLKYDPLNNQFIRLPISDNSSKDLNNQLKHVAQHPNGSIYVLGEHNIYQVNDNNTLGAILNADRLNQAFAGQVSSLKIDVNGLFFVAARGALLQIKADENNQYQVTVHTDDQLPDSYFYSIELDSSQNPWLSSNNGIVQFNRQDQKFNQFGASDGVLVREFNDNASLTRPNGQIIFGGVEGWSTVNPQQAQVDRQAPKLILSSFQIGNNPASNHIPEEGLHISHSDHWIHFSFSALDFHNPEENRYSYYLRGFDPNWRSYGHKSFVDFTGLPPGRYTLQARSATKRGQWNEEPLKIPIYIAPPFYKSSVAYTIYTALFIGLIWLFRNYRRKLSQERKDNLALIETSQNRMKLALWGSGDSIWDWNLEDDKVFRTSLHFLGYDEEENIGDTISTFKELIHPEDLETFEYEVGEVLVGHTNEYSAQYRLKDKNGSWHWVADQGKVIETTASKRPIRLSGTIRDISVIKRHEQELQELNDELEKKVALTQEQCATQSDELTDTKDTLKNTQDQLVESEKKASLGNLVAGITHEINTPVGIALTAASHNTLAIEHLQNLFLQRKLTVKEMEKGLRQLKSSNERIESSINRTAQLIHTFKQVAVDHDQHEWRIIELPFYLIEIVPTFNAQISGLNFKLEVVDGPFFDAESSPGDLYQIISQLVHNSVTHGFKGRDNGKITIETELKGEEWQLRYSDNGNGIDEETKNQIFDPFYSTRRDDGFAGLGMHLVSNIVNHSLGGTIECRSDIGKGVRFVITLPLRRPNSPSLDMLQDFMI